MLLDVKQALIKPVAMFFFAEKNIIMAKKLEVKLNAKKKVDKTVFVVGH